ncbi:FAA-hydrolase domain-containing protein [Mycena kentingensis (nom. inval.)]|nr:FAA-hydrolase domain-containing protein [Mycena kentingensis (nom. inval.)]
MAAAIPPPPLLLHARRHGCSRSHPRQEGQTALSPSRSIQHGPRSWLLDETTTCNACQEAMEYAPAEPFMFLKPTSSYLASGGKMEIPEGVLAHHEVELGIVIGKTGRDISEAEADSYVAGYALAVDMTGRNVQDHVKKKGLPWTTAKGFDTFTPIGSFTPREQITDPHNLTLTLKINGAFKQNGSTSAMIFQIPRLIQHISSIMTLEEGDLILTGTPEGVSQVSPGNKVECTLVDTASGKQLASLDFDAVSRAGGYKFVGL